MSQKPGKAVSQWSTPSSRPLAAWESVENGPKARKSREPVVHSVEWTTSYPRKCRKRVKSQEKLWTTGCPKKYSNLAESSEKSRAYAPLADQATSKNKKFPLAYRSKLCYTIVVE